MRTVCSTAAVTLILLILPAHGAAEPEVTDGSVPAGRGVVVWIVSPGEDARELRKAAAPLLEELELALVVERAGASPSVYQALETLAVHHALAAVWHGETGGLQLLFSGEGAPERLTTAAGAPGEEALYVREVLRARLEQEGELIFDLLATAPGELVEPLPPPPAPERPPGEVVVHAGSRIPRSGGRLGIGYGVRGHIDQVTWAQHGLVMHVPAWRFEQGFVLRAMLTVGLPASIGDSARDRLEIRTLGALLGAAWIPVEQRWFELELGGGGGVEQSYATAFLATGQAKSAEHLAGQLAIWAALVWHPTPGMDVRLHLGGVFVLRPPSYSINGNGGFAAFPWQPFAGVDVAAALF